MKRLILLIMLAAGSLFSAIDSLANNPTLPFKVGSIITDVNVSEKIKAYFYIYHIPEYTVQNAQIKFTSNPKAYLGGFHLTNIGTDRTATIPATINHAGYQITVDSIAFECKFPSRQIEHIILPETFTNITASAFKQAYYLTSIDIPNTVKKIGNQAFAYTQLAQIDLSHIEHIGDSAFYNTKLQSLHLSNTEIGEYSFANNSSLQDVSISNVKTISGNAFYSNSTLKTINLLNIDSIGTKAFADNRNLNKAELKNVRALGDSAFYNCDLESFDPSTTTSIGRSTFANNRNMLIGETGACWDSIGTEIRC